MSSDLATKTSMISTKSLLDQIVEMKTDSEAASKRHEDWMEKRSNREQQPSLADIMQALQTLLADFATLKLAFQSEAG